MVDAAIEISNLNVGYGRGEVIVDVSLCIRYKTVTAIVGANGAGKSTLLRAMVGDLRPMSGSVAIDGQAITEMSGRQRARSIAFVEQSVEGELISVGDYVMLGRMPHRNVLSVRDGRRDREIVDEALSEVGIKALKDKALNCISGGERQLASIARAMVQQSPIMLFDEPTSSLDIANQRRILSIVRRLAERDGKAVVIVVHDINQALAVADEVVVMKRGRLLAHGQMPGCVTQELLQTAYDTEVCVVRDDASGRIVVLPRLE